MSRGSEACVTSYASQSTDDAAGDQSHVTCNDGDEEAGGCGCTGGEEVDGLGRGADAQERYFTLENDRITVRGFITVYPDDSASHSFDEGTHEKAAANLEDAQRKLFAITGVGTAALSPLTVEATER